MRGVLTTLMSMAVWLSRMWVFQNEVLVVVMERV